MDDSTSGYRIHQGAGWIKAKLAALRTQITEVRSLAQKGAGGASKANARLDTLTAQVNAHAPALQSGTALQRAGVTPAYWDLWLDTDNGEHLWRGDRSGGWRQASGVTTVAAGAWDSSASPVWGRSVTVAVPTTLVIGETLSIRQRNVGSGFGLIGASNIPESTGAPVVNPNVQLRHMQFVAATTNAFSFVWEITRT